MRPLVLLFSMILCTTFSVFSQTVIPPGDVSGTWLSTGSPYQVQGDIQIPNDSTLNIEPGVTVEFQGHFALNVQGRLIAIGTETDTIIFTVNDTSGFSNPDTGLGGWYGIRFIDTPSNNDSSKFIYCIFQYGKAVGDFWHANAGGALCVIQFSKIHISHSLFLHNSAGGSLSDVPSGGAVHLAWSDVLLTNNTFLHNRAINGGAIQFHESDPIFVNNTFIYNNARDGGGISFGGISHPTFLNDQISHNKATNLGGGIFGSDSTAIFINVTISNNTADWGGGIGITNCVLEMNNCNLTDNAAAGLGGGIAADFSTLYLNNTIFSRDTSGSQSGAVHSWYSYIQASQCQFRDNISVIGGGIHAEFSRLEIENSTFSRNSAMDGAGIDAYCIDLLLDSCDFVQNVAYNAAASIQYNADTTEFSQPYQVELTHNRFELNFTPNLVAGVTINQFNSDSSLVDLLVDNCVFSSNSADHATSFRIRGSVQDFIVSNSIFNGNDALRWAAGPFLIVKCQGQFINCQFNSNQASVGGGTSAGGGAAVTQEAQIDFLNCTFVNNSSGFGGGLYIRTGGTVNVMNSLFWDNTEQQISINTTDNRISSLTINYCNIQNGLDSISVDTSSIFNWGDGNMDVDPLFVHPVGADYHLQDGSPCIGAGIDSLEIMGTWYLAPITDLEGNPRPNPAGSMPDMGAYESTQGSPVGIEDNLSEQIPNKYFISQNYPNPFNPITHIRFALPIISDVKIELYNILGQRVSTLINARMPAGYHILDFDGGHFASGIYICRIEASNSSTNSKQIFVDIKKIVLMK